MRTARPTRSRLTTATAVIGACAVVWLGSDLSRTPAPSAQLTPARPPTTSAPPAPTAPSAPAKATVSRVVDARTVLTSAGERVVVAGLAPPGPCWSAAATDFATTTLLGAEITLVDPVPILAATLTPREPLADGISAITATLTLPDGTDYAATALHQGQAKPLPTASPAHHAATTAAGAAAQGLWGQPCLGEDTLHVQVPPPPPNPTTAPKPPGAKTNPQPYYRNCTAARASGNTPIPKGTPGYRPALDRDHNGLACER
ncbi:excalibur calcium-binding domain-containing protein [Actinokineospora sp. NPDC004072]